ncbi:Gfo/Idh/MocA family oxidoreductase [Prolixibacteraceae bacterium JC049]|nr:Gfo/Idh/MocA family oxidoreductase [Prolixibacteraceae bacterium JC049]
MKKISRRSFVRNTAMISAGAMIFPNLIGCKQTKKRPNGKLHIAVIGVGGRGMANWQHCLQEKIVAFCDADPRRAAQAYEKFPKIKQFTDFRVMFDKMADDIDAVVISTPDHTHFPATMAAMELGKHVYVEKPLAHNIWQLRTLRKAAHHYGVVTQMGNQGHASNAIRSIKEWYDADTVGDVREVMAWFNGPHFNPKGYFCKPDKYPPLGEKIPEGVDWNAWLGPAAERPYSHYYLPRFWRSWFDFGTGMLGDWGCHTLDAPFFSLDLGMPKVVECINRTPENTQFLPDNSKLKFHFDARGNKPPVTLTWHDGGQKPENRPEWGMKELPSGGMLMIGDKKTIHTGPRPTDNPRIIMPQEEWDHFKANQPAQTIARVKNENPVTEWIAAIKGEGPMPGSNFDYSTRLTEMILLGVLAQRFNTKIEYDEKNMQITNHPELNQYIKEPVRKGWSYGENLWG